MVKKYDTVWEVVTPFRPSQAPKGEEDKKSISSIGVAYSADRDELWRLFDQIGEEQVRLSVQRGNYDERLATYALAWLDEQSSKWSDLDRRALHALAREANNVARGSSQRVQEVSTLTQNAGSIAREAKETADLALIEARANSKTAMAAVLVAAIAILVAFCALFFR